MANLSFDQIYQLASEDLEDLKFQRRDLFRKFPISKDLLKLSVFVLSSFTTNSNLIKKIELLHRRVLGEYKI